MVDAVVTWVDGDDPEHCRERIRFLDGRAEGLGREATDATRFRSKGEIYYCLHLLRQNASWIRKVFLVTDRQRPDFLTPEEEVRLGVTVVDHREIFRDYEDALPTFNSLSIETVLHRIPGLDDEFLYLNDDIFLLKPVVPSEFFADRVALWRGLIWPGNPVAFRVQRKLRRLQKRWARRWYVDGLVGFCYERHWLRGRDHLQLGHALHPMRRSLLTECLEGRIAANVRYRFRHADQFNPVTLAANYELGRGMARLGPRDWGYLDCKKEPGEAICRKMAEFIDDPKVRMVCVQSMDRASPEVAEELKSMLQQVLDGGGALHE
ncbi:stealth family protein [Thioalkalivibrio sp. AKL6]|uniref:stealth family protein n=1 Tax=Thioalkalivibrio sp. AKL6 TaxID=1158154 RepID=UPI00036C797A|nr:stealth family protein [Thioalkalivibrio sp. AKL6]